MAAVGTYDVPVTLQLGDTARLHLGTVAVHLEVELGAQPDLDGALSAVVRTDEAALLGPLADLLEQAARSVREGGTPDAAAGPA